jgi:redox-sensitive bicupin YhaK (pirin superfamily)
MAKIMTPPERRRWKPGQKCPISGQYDALQQKRKFGRFRYAHQITMVEGDTFPPHGDGAVRYMLSDRTRHE